MRMKRFLLILAVAAVAAAQGPAANAQADQRVRVDGGWTALGGTAYPVPAEQRFEGAKDLQIEESPGIVRSNPGLRREPANTRIVGTWVITVTPVGAPVFSSLQTYNIDGTMTETSSHLAQLASGPSHGVWQGRRNTYAVTFELFAFDPSGQAVGRIRVRSTVRVTSHDALTADGVVDFIQPDGTVVPNIGSTPFTGSRMKAVSSN